MLTQPQVQRYSNESGLRDIMIAEKEAVLTSCFNFYPSAHSEPAGLQALRILSTLYKVPAQPVFMRFPVPSNSLAAAL